MIKIVKGSDKHIIIRLKSGSSSDPFDLTNASEIRACFKKTDLTSLYAYYLNRSGTTVSGSDILFMTDTSSISEGNPVYGPGIPTGTTVLKTPASTSSPTPAGQIKLSANATISSTDSFQVGEIFLYQPAVLGKIRIHLSESDTDLLEVGEEQSFELKIVIDGFTSYVQFEAQLNIVDRFC